jgi:putative transposase
MRTIPLTRGEETALFRLGIIGDLLARELHRGELKAELQHRAQARYRPPGADNTRQYSWKTLQRWYYAAKRGTRALRPASRAKGFALALTDEQRRVLLEVRRTHPSASADLILAEAVRHGLLNKGEASVPTLRRLFREEGLPRTSLKRASRKDARRRWQAEKPGALWHGDVCHVEVTFADGSQRHVRVHALLDDASRRVLALEVFDTERERDMLLLFCTALLEHPACGVLYLDNGACYRGKVLAAACARLDIALVHAEPYDAEARGKMERFWRTMRQQVTDHLGVITDVHQLRVALWAWLDRHYHRRPHGSLMGATPMRAWRDGLRNLPAPLTARQLAEALEVTVTRKVAKDGTLSIDGVTYEVAGRHLAGKSIEIVLDPLTDTVLRAQHQGRDVPIGLCDPRANAHRSRPEPSDEPVAAPEDLPFHPIAGLLAAARQEPDHE